MINSRACVTGAAADSGDADGEASRNGAEAAPTIRMIPTVSSIAPSHPRRRITLFSAIAPGFRIYCPAMDDYRRLGRALFAPGGDDAFARIAVGRRYVTDAQLRECGDGALPQELLRRGLISTDQVLTVLQIQNGDLRWCERCDAEYDPRVLTGCPACDGDGAARIGRYRVIREVARGGMGVVLEAEADDGRRVALKVIPEREAGLQEIERLRREAKIARRLQHPNIVRIHEMDMTRDPSGGPLHYLVMDYVEGRTLAQVMREGDRPRVLRLLLQVADAVAYAHAEGVLHRDLKPSNVIVADSGEAVLADFGLARDSATGTMLTPTHAVMGTAQYMAPEQVMGVTRHIDARTDVYALGVMLYEAATGRLPYAAPAQDKLFEMILTAEPTPPDDAALAPICARAMRKDPRTRYPDGAAFAAALREALASGSRR